MKTAAEWMMQFGKTTTPPYSNVGIPQSEVTVLDAGDIQAIQLDAIRYGMEQAARMCERLGDAFGKGKAELNDDEMNLQGGCYDCAKLLSDAAKTAQLP